MIPTFFIIVAGVILVVGNLTFAVLWLDERQCAIRATARGDSAWELFEDYILIGLISDYRANGREAIAARYRALFGDNTAGLEHLLGKLQALNARILRVDDSPGET